MFINRMLVIAGEKYIAAELRRRKEKHSTECKKPAAMFRPCFVRAT